MEELRRIMRNYRQLDNAIRELNKQATILREERKIKELELGDILRDPQYQSYNVLKVEDDGSTIKIQRPGTYCKPWTLSKKDLEENVTLYFAETSTPNAKECVEFIVEQQKQKLLSTDFSFTRTLKNDTMKDD